jgi:hypothetical protein
MAKRVEVDYRFLQIKIVIMILWINAALIITREVFKSIPGIGLECCKQECF